MILLFLGGDSVGVVVVSLLVVEPIVCVFVCFSF